MKNKEIIMSIELTQFQSLYQPLLAGSHEEESVTQTPTLSVGQKAFAALKNFGNSLKNSCLFSCGRSNSKQLDIIELEFNELKKQLREKETTPDQRTIIQAYNMQDLACDKEDILFASL